MHEICNEIDRLLSPYRKEMEDLCVLFEPAQKITIATSLEQDLRAKMEQDPVSRKVSMVFLSNSFRAILAYRVAHWLYERSCSSGQESYFLIAHKISEAAAAQTSIEINPAATIGRSFVIDHGINTLIGATAEIGDHCTLLNNVLLGARKITNNKEGKRHPSIGNYVQIASSVSILGPVRVGDHAFIGPGCLITDHVPAYSQVKLMKSIQITVRQEKKAS